MNELPLPRLFSLSLRPSLTSVAPAPVYLLGLVLAGPPLGIVVSLSCRHCLRRGCLPHISSPQLLGRQGVLDVAFLLGTSCGQALVYLTHFWRDAELV